MEKKEPNTRNISTSKGRRKCVEVNQTTEPLTICLTDPQISKLAMNFNR